MKTSIDSIVRAVLYEGYNLYPYRPSVKTRQRWTFGGLVPRAYSEFHRGSDRWRMQTQILLIGDESASLDTTVRFLQPIQRPGLPQQEAIEQTVSLGSAPIGDLVTLRCRQRFSFDALTGSVDLTAEQIEANLFRVSVKISNETELDQPQSIARDDAMLLSLASTHVVLRTRGGRFVSLTDPPPAFRSAAAVCKNDGCWPVLVGDAGDTDAMLASPIILYDYPQVAPESPGDLFDGTEIDEILTLRILTLSDAEKQNLREHGDDRTRELLRRTESLAREQLMSLHGTIRTPQPANHGESHAT